MNSSIYSLYNSKVNNSDRILNPSLKFYNTSNIQFHPQKSNKYYNNYYNVR